MDRHVSDGGFRWEYPLCGKSRLKVSIDESEEEDAINALRAHIFASVGTNHGPRNEYLPDFDREDLAEHVISVQ